jgi:hypothetical protein
MKTQLQKNLDTARGAYVDAVVAAAYAALAADVNVTALAAYINADAATRAAYVAYADARAALAAYVDADTH